MHNNRYFNINASDENINTIMSYSVGVFSEQRFSLDQTKLIIKLCDGDHKQHPELDQYTEYDHSGIMAIAQSDEYQTPNPLP